MIEYVIYTKILILEINFENRWKLYFLRYWIKKKLVSRLPFLINRHLLIKLVFHTYTITSPCVLSPLFDAHSFTLVLVSYYFFFCFRTELDYTMFSLKTKYPKKKFFKYTTKNYAFVKLCQQKIKTFYKKRKPFI